MARTQSSVKSLCVLLAKRIFCTETVQTADALHIVPSISRPLQTLSAGKPRDVTVAGQTCTGLTSCLMQVCTMLDTR